MDLLDVLEAETRRRAGETLDALNVNVMSHTTNVDDFRKFADGLRTAAGYTQSSAPPKYDAAGIKLLRDQMRAGVR
ncbi:hypothetical protein PAECIP111892_01762 [Paenibacillus auburnensis]|uniref:Uncharacterized protein n=1 Tax=Paenibacillus auburnensis TaxID=2905649 RepID=A0ABM9BVG2_9BACL|nr:hypothetical protein [Paenibacillus auburnensis]CAH1194607.1 hypothetical protein PAECIP111892_01762 [Paenibacillus auburnensis]